MDSVAATSRWIAAVRARESEAEHALFNDPLARKLAGQEGFAYLDRMIELQPEGVRALNVAYLVLRTRFLDDLLTEAANAGIRQVVLLAAGMDARAFRMAWPPGTALYELDQPEVIAYKNALLGAESPACRRVPIGVDLRDDWVSRLLASGFQPERPCAWLVEGLLMYLEAPAAEAVLNSVSSLSAPGSRLGIDLINADFLTHPRMRPMLDYMEESGAPWRYGINEPERYLAGLGWEATVVQPGELPYDRWPLPTRPRETPGVPRTFFVEAWRT
jgi:methyltransferase (TIGR00027 family)